MNPLKNIDQKNYQQLFAIDGLQTLINDLYIRVYNNYDFFIIVQNTTYQSFITQKCLDQCAQEGKEFLSSKNNILNWKQDIETTLIQLEENNKNIANKKISTPETQAFFTNTITLLSLYKYTDNNFTKGFEEEIKNTDNKNLLNHLQEIGEYKNVIREHINQHLTANNSTLHALLTNISNNYDESFSNLFQYTQSEIITLITTNTPLAADQLKTRNQGIFLKRINNQTHYQEGKEVANLLITLNNQHQNTDIKGSVAYSGTITAKARVITIDYTNPNKTTKQIQTMQPGEILVSQNTSPELIPACKKASGIITDLGGIISHAAVIARELKIPCIVGATNASTNIQTGDIITLNGTSGIITIEKSVN